MSITETAQKTWKGIFRQFFTGMRDAFVAFFAILHKLVITVPYAVLTVVIFAFVIYHVITIGTARAERDALDKQCVELTQQVENLKR